MNVQDVRVGNLDINAVPGDDLLPSNRSGLDLDVHGAKGLGTDVYLDQPWIHRLVKLSKLLVRQRAVFVVELATMTMPIDQTIDLCPCRTATQSQSSWGSSIHIHTILLYEQDTKILYS